MSISSSSIPKDYILTLVSWEDSSRGLQSNGSLSCWGNNITDVRLKGKNGENFKTIRSQNWNEKLGKVSANQVAVIAYNNGVLSPQTLQTWLKEHDCYNPELDTEITIRFQTCFLPNGTEFCAEHYNYQTKSDEDPKNLLLLCTSQGTSLEQDGPGYKKLFVLKKDPETGRTYRHYLEIESTAHKVGGAQIETEAERNDAIQRGKATATVIGTREMGTRFNVLMSVQIPLEQKPLVLPRKSSGTLMMCQALGAQMMMCEALGASSITSNDSYFLDDDEDYEEDDDEDYEEAGAAQLLFTRGAHSLKRKQKQGKSSAARVSYGTKVDEYKGIKVKKPVRNKHELITITCTFYYAVENGDPSDEDIKAACEDLDNLYKTSCYWTGNLSNPEVKKSYPSAVTNFDVFPS